MTMPIQIELPERLMDMLESRAVQLHSSVEAVAIEAIELGMANAETGSVQRQRVLLPLIHSANPENCAH